MYFIRNSYENIYVMQSRQSSWMSIGLTSDAKTSHLYQIVFTYRENIFSFHKLMVAVRKNSDSVCAHQKIREIFI